MLQYLRSACASSFLQGLYVNQPAISTRCVCSMGNTQHGNNICMWHVQTCCSVASVLRLRGNSSAAMLTRTCCVKRMRWRAAGGMARCGP